MTGTSFVVGRAHADRIARAYVNGPSGPAPMADPQTLPFGPMTLVYSPSRALDTNAYPSAGAGMIGSASDVLRLLEAVRKGGAPVLKEPTAAEMFRNQIDGIPGFQPGDGFGLGGGLIVDPAVTKTPQSAGTLFWGGVYGHNWFVDPVKRITVVVFTNTAPEGMAGKFPDGLRDAVYQGLR
jgi:CubicO group peptidase (beta-lactamase class C family)